MISAPIRFASLSFLVLAGAILAPGSTAMHPAAASFEGSADPALKDQILKLAAKNDHAGIAKLAKARKEDFIAWIVVTCEDLVNTASDDGEKFAQILRDAWKEGPGGEFAEKEYQGLKGLGANKKDRNELKKRFDAAAADLEKNVDHKDNLVFSNVVDELEVVAPGLEQVGDWYRASEAWIVQAHAYDEELRGASADLHKAYLAYAKAVEARDKIELKDASYEAIAKRKAALLAKGYDKKKESPAEAPAAGGAPPVAAGPADAPGGPITAAANFDPVPTIEAYARPNYTADEVHQTWGTAIQLKKKGSSGSFPRIPNGPALVRMGADDLRFDTNGDGTGDEKVGFTGSPMLVKVSIGKGADARPWAFIGQIGSEKDQYERITINQAHNDDFYAIFALGAASIVADVGGVPIRIIDEDMDSMYGNPPIAYGEPGLVSGDFQPEMDSIVIGSSKRARPFSEIQQVGDKWYKLETSANAKEVKAFPLAVETGVLKLDFKGATPSWVVVQGVGDKLKNCRFDLVEGGTKGVTVPAGKYALYYGEIRKGKKLQTQKVVILPGKATPTWQVDAGKTVTVTLGAPFGFDFKSSLEGDKLKVEGKTVVVVGSASERYERAWGCVPRPEVFWRKKGTKTSSKGEKMPAIIDLESLEKKGYDAAWFPLDFESTLKNEKGPVEVQLVEKKHDLFGKIESDWK